MNLLCWAPANDDKWSTDRLGTFRGDRILIHVRQSAIQNKGMFQLSDLTAESRNFYENMQSKFIKIVRCRLCAVVLTCERVADSTATASKCQTSKVIRTSYCDTHIHRRSVGVRRMTNKIKWAI